MKIGANVINRKGLESLVWAGACDNLEGHRAQQFESIDDALRWGHKISEEATSSQESLFGNNTAVANIAPPALPDIEKWSTDDCLRNEKKTQNRQTPICTCYNMRKKFNSMEC